LQQIETGPDSKPAPQKLSSLVTPGFQSSTELIDLSNKRQQLEELIDEQSKQMELQQEELGKLKELQDL